MRSVADNRMTKMIEMFSDLMLTPRFRKRLDERITRSFEFSQRHRDFRLVYFFKKSDSFLRFISIVGQVVIHLDFFGKPSSDDCQISFGYRLIFDLLLNAFYGFRVKRKKQDPRSFSIQPMNRKNVLIDLVAQCLKCEDILS